MGRSEVKMFRQQVLRYYRTSGRHTLLWRKTRDPYKILISEIMLQQTQVSRVMKFYPRFVKEFPNFRALARAPLKSVLKVWQGMGYNRRAVALKKLASIIIDQYGGRLPSEVEVLKKMPGVGKATAGAIAAYAFNRPVPFIETNIRRIFIYHFFQSVDRREPTPAPLRGRGFNSPLERGGRRPGCVRDEEILKLVEATLDHKNPREWYWALTDYGAMLGIREKENPNVRSTQYRRQSKFEGSRRQVRGEVLKLLLQKGSASKVELKEFGAVLSELVQEGFITRDRGMYRLA